GVGLAPPARGTRSPRPALSEPAARTADGPLGPQAPRRVRPPRLARAEGLAPRSAALLRHTPSRRRRRPARDPGAPGPRLPLDDPEVHAPGDRPAHGGLRSVPPTRHRT